MSNLIETLLRQPEERRLQAYVDRLVKQNQEASYSLVPGFLYQGLAYRHSSALKGKLEFSGLHPSLYEAMDEFLVSKENVERDIQMINQGLRPLIKSCLTIQDLRDALPECIITLIGKSVDNMSELSRTREPAWPLEATGRGMNQYLRVLPLIETYCAARFLY